MDHWVPGREAALAALEVAEGEDTRRDQLTTPHINRLMYVQYIIRTHTCHTMS